MLTSTYRGIRNGFATMPYLHEREREDLAERVRTGEFLAVVAPHSDDAGYTDPTVIVGLVPADDTRLKDAAWDLDKQTALERLREHLNTFQDALEETHDDIAEECETPEGALRFAFDRLLDFAGDAMKALEDAE